MLSENRQEGADFPSPTLQDSPTPPQNVGLDGGAYGWGRGVSLFYCELKVQKLSYRHRSF